MKVFIFFVISLLIINQRAYALLTCSGLKQDLEQITKVHQGLLADEKQRESEKELIKELFELQTYLIKKVKEVCGCDDFSITDCKVEKNSNTDKLLAELDGISYELNRSLYKKDDKQSQKAIHDLCKNNQVYAVAKNSCKYYSEKQTQKDEAAYLMRTSKRYTLGYVKDKETGEYNFYKKAKRTSTAEMVGMSALTTAAKFLPTYLSIRSDNSRIDYLKTQGIWQKQAQHNQLFWYKYYLSNPMTYQFSNYGYTNYNFGTQYDLYGTYQNSSIFTPTSTSSTSSTTTSQEPAVFDRNAP